MDHTTPWQRHSLGRLMAELERAGQESGAPRPARQGEGLSVSHTLPGPPACVGWCHCPRQPSGRPSLLTSPAAEDGAGLPGTNPAPSLSQAIFILLPMTD